jgi:flagellar motility protein MotE (MotC chaperone)
MLNFISKLRFLPVTIFATSLMLTVKIGDIWRGVDGALNGAISIAGAEAQQPNAQQPAALSPAATGKPAEKAPEKPAPAAKTGTATKTAIPGGGAASSLASDDPTLLTQAEIDLLQHLAERREVLEGRERELEMRTGMLNAAETRINGKIKELQVLQATIDQLIKKYDVQQEEKIVSLVKIYENMKPKDAARIFEEMDMVTLLMVAERMKERKLAPIMASMNAGKATEITVELSKLRDMPKPGSEVGG